MEITPIAHIRTDFPEKFGIPRQSNLVESCRGTIEFEPEFAQPECVRGIEGYDYLWLVWRFDHGKKNTWSPTVRPPILGGNKRVGVFATRSPFRPNPLGLSSVRLESVEMTTHGPVLHVLGADLRDGTEIYDIKPYIPADIHTDIRGGITENTWTRLTVDLPQQFRDQLGEEAANILVKILELDPRPATHHDPSREYAMGFRTVDVRFTVNNEEGILHVVEIVPRG